MAKSSYALLPGTTMKKIGFVSVAFATLFAAGAASAQFVWLDEKGVKQYSDMPPPPSVPKSRILKGLSKEARAANPADAAVSDNKDKAPTANADKQPMTTAERNAEFQKRRTEQAEKEKKAAEQEKLAADKEKSCERAREYQRTLESGVRITRSDKDGERTFVSDEERARELRDTRTLLQECKS
jgi:hypothetical protein